MQTMICLGDSLTEATDIPVGHAWPSLVANSIHLDVINHGIGGDTTAGMLARFYPDVVAAKPAIVLIMGGTNDLWWDLEVNAILANLFSIVFQARHHGIAPMIGMPPPVAVAVAETNDFSPPWGGYECFTDRLTEFCKALGTRATESEVPFVDLYKPFLTADREANNDLFLPDGLHPNRTGQDLIAKTVADGLHIHFNF